jgi:hypothetical protein
MKRILLGHLGVYGDLLHATVIARQIKKDNPDCHLTWGVGSRYADILQENPDVDSIWEFPVANRWEVTSKWYEFENLALYQKFMGEFDEIYLTQIYPGQPTLFHDTLRAAMYRTYPNEITVPKIPRVFLTFREIDEVRAFATKYNLHSCKNVILFEWSPQSNQSFVTEEFVLAAAGRIVTVLPNTVVILSGEKPIVTNDLDIVDASYLSFRENAELTVYCNLFIGTGSGITQIVQTNWAKDLPMIMLLNKRSTASVITDYEYFDLPTGGVIEMSECTSVDLANCVVDSLVPEFGGFQEARKRYNKKITPDLTIIRFHMLFDKALRSKKYGDILKAFILTSKEYGFTKDYLYFLSTIPSSILTLVKRRIKGVT